MKSLPNTQPLTARTLVSVLLLGCAAISFSLVTSRAEAQDAIELDVYKDESCGCCGNWIEHMKLNDFVSTVHHPRDLNGVKLQQGIQPQLQSCHTAITKDGYVFEGHVPAKFVRQFLASPPANARGLLVPGMPMGSPGMEVGNRFNQYDVLLLKKDGTTEVYVTVKRAADQY